MKLIYKKLTKEIIGITVMATSSEEFGYADVPEGFEMKDRTLWEYDPSTDSIIRK